MRSFDGEGEVYLIERSLTKVGSIQVVTEDFLHDYVWKASFPSGSPQMPISTTNPTVEEYLTLIVSVRQTIRYDGSLLPLPMSENVFHQLSEQLRVPDIFLPVIQRRTPLRTNVNLRIPRHEADLDDCISFIVHSNINTEFCYAASISYNIKEHRMFAFVHCLDSRILRNFLSLIDSATHEILTTFWMIPSILVELGLEWIQRTQDAYHDDIYQLETATGVRRDSSTTEDLENTDLRKLTRDVNFTITNLDFHSYSLDTLRPILHAVDDAVRLYRKKVLAINTSNTWASQVERAVLEKNAYLCAWSDGMGKRGKYLQERGQAQVQTIYSLIAQKDNVLNRKLTEASIQQTKASQQLAKTSTDLAMMTSRDSTVMRTIAAVTIFFLPATFSATFFSTSFFDFHGDRNSNVVSWWLWLYFVVTVALTGTSLGGWHYYAKRKEAELVKLFRTS